MGRPKVTLYSLVIQPPIPLFKQYHPAIRPVCSPPSPVTKCTTCFSAWGICGLHPPCTFNNALTKSLPGNRVAICRALYALRGVSPAFVPQQRTRLVMLAKKHTINARSLSDPSDHAARGVPTQDALARTPLWLMMMKVFPSGNGPRNPKQAACNDYRRLALSPQASICPPSDGQFTPQPERSDYPGNEGW
ncbi:hypothetical protein O181_091772 [Austropuccinia psidii MF-1]|uniref:Uncharacterized protein n=1 Tax=Austropuccinia psidii MF-1 TaxID=1389203 RepID=A0A9Q3IXW6_9BASI|nr:hypothetical protein [Austropuccinia psidii MF-1]